MGWGAVKPRDDADSKRRGSAYDRHRRRVAARQASASADGREIGPPPPPASPARRGRSENDFRRFCETYFPNRFPLEWSRDHLTVIDRIEAAVVHGLRFALAMPRGSGKTTLCVVAAIWAVLTGKRRYVVLIGADKDAASELLASIKAELETNELLAADYPEVCYAVRKLERIVQRCQGQTINGQPTRMRWKGSKIILPTVAGSPSSGAVIQAVGITGRIRGLQHTLADGSLIRPDLAIPDDPQTDASAFSPSQTARRIRILTGDVMGLAGPGIKIAMLMPCTVIAMHDMADQLLDREKHPEFNGIRTKAVIRFPDDEALWAEYAEKRADGMRADDNGAAGNAFYDEHRQRLEAGAEVSWPANVGEGDRSALQTLMNAKIDDEATFWAERQNEPQDQNSGAADRRLDPDQLAGQIIQTPRLRVPVAAPNLVAFIDPNLKILHYLVVAFGDGFRGHIVDYGVWPDQNRPYWTTRDAKRTMGRALPGQTREAQILNGLTGCADHILNREYEDEQGTKLRVRWCGVDYGLGLISDVVFQFCRESKHAAILMPCKGIGLKPSDVPFPERKQRPGDTIGHHWRINAPDTRRQRHLLVDVNRWKSFVAQRLQTYPATPGSITIYHASRARHRLLLDHLSSETPKPVESSRGQLDLYEQMRGRDNDLWDCLVGCAAGASTIGVSAEGHVPLPQRRRRRRVQARF